MDMESADMLGMEARPMNVNICKFLNDDKTREDVEKSCSVTLLTMLEAGLHANITIKANGGSVKSHSCLLASVSPVFEAIFKHQMQEQLTSTVELLEMSIKGLEVFLILIYILPDNTDEMDEFSFSIYDRFTELFEACRKYQVKKLEPILTDYLIDVLNPENCWDYLRKSEAFSGFCASLDHKTSNVGPYAACRDYIVAHFHKVIESWSFIPEMQADPMNVLVCLRELLRTAQLPVKPAPKRNGPRPAF